mmetsp:Transcript_15201/g.22292  ORF Transcript_15201/g.22292 Transcript_15201/m.22292 type:complete len:270 (+) Transcript_15201:981-1790(+)
MLGDGICKFFFVDVSNSRSLFGPRLDADVKPNSLPLAISPPARTGPLQTPFKVASFVIPTLVPRICFGKPPTPSPTWLQHNSRHYGRILSHKIFLNGSILPKILSTWLAIRCMMPNSFNVSCSSCKFCPSPNNSRVLQAICGDAPSRVIGPNEMSISCCTNSIRSSICLPKRNEREKSRKRLPPKPSTVADWSWNPRRDTTIPLFFYSTLIPSIHLSFKNTICVLLQWTIGPIMPTTMHRRPTTTAVSCRNFQKSPRNEVSCHELSSPW